MFNVAPLYTLKYNEIDIYMIFMVIKTVQTMLIGDEVS